MYPDSFLQLAGGDAPVTCEEADIYFASRTASSEWSIISEVEREKALVSATQMLSELAYKGYVKDVSQQFPFPRIGEYLDDSKGVYVSLDDIPKRYIETVYELSLHLLQQAPSRGASVTSLSVGPITLSGIKKAAAFPSDIAKRIRPLLRSGGGNQVWRAN
jgi:hypothetical protein